MDILQFYEKRAEGEEAILEDVKTPCVGLSYVLEVKGKHENEDCHYICLVCKTKLSKETIAKHLMTSFHQRNYMDIQFPHLKNEFSNSGYEHERAQKRCYLRLILRQHVKKIGLGQMAVCSSSNRLKAMAVIQKHKLDHILKLLNKRKAAENPDNYLHDFLYEEDDDNELDCDDQMVTDDSEENKIIDDKNIWDEFNNEDRLKIITDPDEEKPIKLMNQMSQNEESNPLLELQTELEDISEKGNFKHNTFWIKFGSPERDWISHITDVKLLPYPGPNTYSVHVQRFKFEMSFKHNLHRVVFKVTDPMLAQQIYANINTEYSENTVVRYDGKLSVGRLAKKWINHRDLPPLTYTDPRVERGYINVCGPILPNKKIHETKELFSRVGKIHSLTCINDQTSLLIYDHWSSVSKLSEVHDSFYEIGDMKLEVSQIFFGFFIVLPRRDQKTRTYYTDYMGSYLNQFGPLRGGCERSRDSLKVLFYSREASQAAAEAIYYTPVIQHPPALLKLEPHQVRARDNFTNLTISNIPDKASIHNILNSIRNYVIIKNMIVSDNNETKIKLLLTLTDTWAGIESLESSIKSAKCAFIDKENVRFNPRHVLNVLEYRFVLQVTNVPEQMSRTQIWIAFKKLTNIKDISFVTDTHPAHILIFFKTKSDSLQAIKSLDNYNMGGNRIKVAFHYIHTKIRSAVHFKLFEPPSEEFFFTLFECGRVCHLFTNDKGNEVEVMYFNKDAVVKANQFYANKNSVVVTDASEDLIVDYKDLVVMDDDFEKMEQGLLENYTREPYTFPLYNDERKKFMDKFTAQRNHATKSFKEEWDVHLSFCIKTHCKGIVDQQRQREIKKKIGDIEKDERDSGYPWIDKTLGLNEDLNLLMNDL